MLFLIVLQCSQGNTLMESLFNKVEGLQDYNFMKTSTKVFSFEYCQYSEELLICKQSQFI